MNVLYLTIGMTADMSNGVVRKINQQTEALIQSGVRAELLSFTMGLPADIRVNDHYEIKAVKVPAGTKFKSLQMQKELYQSIEQYLNQYAKNYDLIYFRYPGANKYLQAICNAFGKKIVFEHNTKELDEIEHEVQAVRKIRFGLKPSQFLSWYEYGFSPMRNEKKYAPQCFQHVLGGVAVSHEIKAYEQQRYKSYSMEVIPNAIKIQSDRKLTSAPYEGNELRLIQLSGSKSKWHGADRIIRSVAAYTGPVKIRVDFFGEYYDSDIQAVQHMQNGLIYFYPKTDLTALDMSVYHAALGCWATFRKNLLETSALKVREYISQGIPVISSDIDTELSYNPAFAPYYLKLEASESLVDMNQLIRFVESVHRETGFNATIRSLAQKYISAEAAAMKLTRFFKRLLN